MERIYVGNVIRKYRKKRGYTLKEVAEMANLSCSLLEDIEMNKSEPSYENLFKLMYVLDIPNDEFFDDYWLLRKVKERIF